MHPKLDGHSINYPMIGGLALQRSGHTSPSKSDIAHDGARSTADIEWSIQDLGTLDMHDRKHVTEFGAEAVALAYICCKAGWVAKRRINEKEYADWLLINEAGETMALEVSGTVSADPQTRLRRKKLQLIRCSEAKRLAIVVAFNQLSITAGGL